MPTRVTIIGGGPGGLAAAAAAADAGLEPTLVDEAAALGGQYYRGAARPSPIDDASVYLDSIAFDATHDAIQVTHGNQLVSLQLPAILAPGATERVVPVPGWTLPGVVTCGGAQAMAKSYGVPIGSRVLVAGSGPFLLPVAAELMRIGAHVVAVVEASRPGMALASGMLRSGRRLLEGTKYMRQLLWRTPLLTHQAVVEIRGDGAVEEAIVAPVDAHGRLRAGVRRHFDCDAVCLSDGFLPATELAELAGTGIRWESTTRAWCVDADPLTGRTRKADVFAIGAAVEPLGGAQLAAASGALASYALAEQLGAHLSPAIRARRKALIRDARRHLRFAGVLRTTYPTHATWYERTTDETIVCRCEDIRAGEVRLAGRNGANDVNLVKRWTRAGMGLCQGRTCGAFLLELSADRPSRLHPRPPLRPLPVTVLASDRDRGW